MYIYTCAHFCTTSIITYSSRGLFFSLHSAREYYYSSASSPFLCSSRWIAIQGPAEIILSSKYILRSDSISLVIFFLPKPASPVWPAGCITSQAACCTHNTHRPPIGENNRHFCIPRAHIYKPCDHRKWAKRQFFTSFDIHVQLS